MTKYKLTFWQRLTLPFLWLSWSAMPENERKTWHEVKKGMEPHEHTFGEVYWHKGYRFRNCTHEGCKVATTKDDNGNWLDPL